MLSIYQTLNDTYQITEQIGSGGGGIIFKAYHNRMRKFVAIKLIKDEIRNDYYNRSEVDLLKTLKHEYIPQVIDFIEDGNDVYTVMEFVEGQNFKQIIGSGRRFSEAQVRKYACQLCEVAKYLHSHVTPIIHSDIKPANVMLTPNDNICLIDFNISMITDSGYAVSKGGSRNFGAPEQFIKVVKAPFKTDGFRENTRFVSSPDAATELIGESELNHNIHDSSINSAGSPSWISGGLKSTMNSVPMNDGSMGDASFTAPTNTAASGGRLRSTMGGTNPSIQSESFSRPSGQPVGTSSHLRFSNTFSSNNTYGSVHSVSDSRNAMPERSYAPSVTAGAPSLDLHVPHEPVSAAPADNAPLAYIDERTDIYGIGATIYYLLTAKVPTGSDPDFTGIKCSKEMKHIIRKAMMASPDRRYSSAQEMLDELQEKGSSESGGSKTAAIIAAAAAGIVAVSAGFVLLLGGNGGRISDDAVSADSHYFMNMDDQFSDDPDDSSAQALPQADDAIYQGADDEYPVLEYYGSGEILSRLTSKSLDGSCDISYFIPNGLVDYVEHKNGSGDITEVTLYSSSTGQVYDRAEPEFIKDGYKLTFKASGRVYSYSRYTVLYSDRETHYIEYLDSDMNVMDTKTYTYRCNSDDSWDIVYRDDSGTLVYAHSFYPDGTSAYTYYNKDGSVKSVDRKGKKTEDK